MREISASNTSAPAIDAVEHDMPGTGKTLAVARARQYMQGDIRRLAVEGWLCPGVWRDIALTQTNINRYLNPSGIGGENTCRNGLPGKDCWDFQQQEWPGNQAL